MNDLWINSQVATDKGLILLNFYKIKSIRFTVVSIFAIATLITATVATSLQYHFSQKMAIESVSQLFKLSSQHTKDHLASIDTKAENVTKILAQFPGLVTENSINDDTFKVFSEILKSNQSFYAIYIGFNNGDFYELINLQASPLIRSQIKASPADRWVSITIRGKGENRRRIFDYLDQNLVSRTTKEEFSDYDASQRPWYVTATKKQVNKTAPYLFQHLQAPGQTYSTIIADTSAVIAVDIALSSFQDYLVKQGSDKNGDIDREIYLFQKSGEIISSNQVVKNSAAKLPIKKLILSSHQQKLVAAAPTLHVANETNWAPIDFTVSGQPQGYSIDLLNIISSMTGLKFEYINGFTWLELIDKFKRGEIDLLHSLFKNGNNESLGLMSSSFLQLPFSVITQPNKSQIKSIAELNGKTLAIPAGWSVIQEIKQYFPKVTVIELASTKAVLNAVKEGTAYAGLDNDVIFKYIQKQFFIENIQYHTEIDFSPSQISTDLHMLLPHSKTELMAIINLAIEAISDKQRELLAQKWLMMPSDSAKKMTQEVVPYQELTELVKQTSSYNRILSTTFAGKEHFMLLTPVDDKQSSFLAIIVPKDSVFAESIAKVNISILITSLCLLLFIPFSWWFSGPIVKPIKLLALENEKIKNRQYEDVVKVESNIKEIDELASSLFEMSVSIKDHERKQEELMDSFIQLIAQTIDDKSAYTGGHCNRVPELGLMLVDEVVKDESTFRDFSFKSSAEYREFKISAWLHDCGKIITPEHIVDKGSKLETIYNRIHEIRMRFEVLWRDAELNYYQAVIASPEQKKTLRQSLKAKQAKLTHDFAFVANANVGGEFMANEKIERLNTIGQLTWQRHFDNSLGLSPVEESHLAEHTKLSSTSLPVTEQLLADKTEHITPRTEQLKFDKKLGIKMAVPKDKANLGELYNLSISRGTLTTEDRYVINEHIIGTIKMLEQLPFPPELANVPRFASTHHETLIGTGYPRQLTAKELSIPERVLVIADIFEALTAADRPYKKAKPLSVAINILHKFALDQHIDTDLFELFLSSGIYLVYANKYMKSEQIDEVDIIPYLRANTEIKKAG